MNSECFLSTEAFYFKMQDGRRVYREATAGAGKRIRKKWKAQKCKKQKELVKSPSHAPLEAEKTLKEEAKAS